ncbi:MAG TPA: hypothetical protein VI365_09295, partial [Trebonia sp.]
MPESACQETSAQERGESAAVPEASAAGSSGAASPNPSADQVAASVPDAGLAGEVRQVTVDSS